MQVTVKIARESYMRNLYWKTFKSGCNF